MSTGLSAVRWFRRRRFPGSRVTHHQDPDLNRPPGFSKQHMGLAKDRVSVLGKCPAVANSSGSTLCIVENQTSTHTVYDDFRQERGRR